MAKINPQNSMEWEIYRAMTDHGEPDLAADFLLKKFEREKLRLGPFQALTNFLLHAGFYETCVDFILRKFSDGSEIPWAQFAEAIFHSSQEVPDSIKQALLDGARALKGAPELARSHALDHYSPELEKYRSERKAYFWQRYQERRKEFIQELELMISQGLDEQADRLLHQLLRAFPKDPEILTLDRDFKHHRAAKLVSEELKPKEKKTPPLYHYEIIDDETEKTLATLELQMRELALTDSSLACDFALFHFFAGNYAAALRLADLSDQNQDVLWLKSEIMLRGRLFGELLEFLNHLEPQIEADPESTFAIYYLRSQALYGLGDRELAISIMESLVQARPQYRTAHTLLEDWREGHHR